MKNLNLLKAKATKNDEFYTRYEDVEKELNCYSFKDQIIYCNCDDPRKSSFVRYFIHHIQEIKMLIATCYHRQTVFSQEPGYILQITAEDFTHAETEAEFQQVIDRYMVPLEGDGDFTSEECLSILDAADVVVTNPPFSLAATYLQTLVKHQKKFLFIGNKNMVKTEFVFREFQENRLRFGYHAVKEFVKPDGTVQKFGNITWFTNLEVRRGKNLVLTKKYHEKNYQKYRNFNAINVNRLKDIPLDYDGIMGVPITFLDYYNPEDFELLGISVGKYKEALGIRKIGEEWITAFFAQGGKGHYTANMRNLVLLEGGVASAVYARILIRRRKKYK